MIGLLSVLAAAPALAATEPLVRTLPPSMPALEIDNPRGVIEVDYDPSAPKSTLTASPMFWSEGCEVVFTGDAALARVEVHKNGELATTGCRTRFQIVLAGPTALHLQGEKGGHPPTTKGGNAGFRGGDGRHPSHQARQGSVGLGGTTLVLF